MLPSSREIIFHDAIARMQLADDENLLIIDNACNFHTIDLNHLHVSKSISLSNVYEKCAFDYYKRPFALGKNKSYVSFSKEGFEYIIGTKEKLTKNCSFFYNQGTPVTNAFFSEDDKLLISGNEKGRTYVIDTEEGSLKAELPRSSDSITATAVSNEYKLAARASFSKRLIVYKINSLKTIVELVLPSIIERLIFLDQETLLAITRNGKILKIDLDNARISKELMLPENTWPSSMTLSNSKKFLYIGTRESMLFALHVKTFSILFQIKLPYLGITAMIRTAHYFVFGFKTGEVVFYNHREFEEQFITAIQLKNLREIAKLFQKNTFLMSHRATQSIYDYWVKDKEMIENLLSRGEVVEAKLLADPFLFHPKCRFEFSQMELLQPELMAMHRYVRSMRYMAAYELAMQKPYLRKSFVFTNLEAQWNKNFQKAQILLSREPILNKEAVRESLKLFSCIEEKKEIIENMLKHSGIFMMAESAIRNKNFSLYFKLAHANTFLTQTPLYHKVLLLGEKLQQQINTLLNEKEFQQAMAIADILRQFTPYHNQAERYKEVSSALMLIEYHIQHNALLDAIQIQEKYNLQSNYALIKRLEKIKDSFMKQKLVLIEKRAYSNVYATIVPFMKYAVCKEHVATIMKKIYITQFYDAYEKMNETIDWLKTFEAFLQLLPMDKLLVKFANASYKIELLKQLPNTLYMGTNTSYPKTLLVKLDLL